MKKYLLITFILICSLIVGLDILSSYQFLSQLFESMHKRREALGEVHQFEYYLSVLKDAETSQRGFVITGEEEYLEPYEKAINYLKSDEFKQFMAKQELHPDPEHVAKIRQMREIEKKRLEELAIVIEKRKERGFIHAKTQIQDHNHNQHMNKLRDLGGSIIEDKKRLIQQSDQHIEKTTRTTLLLFILGDIASAGLVGLCLLYLYSYIKKLEQKDSELSLAADQLHHALAARQAILNAANYSIIAVDNNGIINSFNPAAEKMLGYSRDEVIGKMTLESLHDRKEIEDYAKELSLKFNTATLVNFDVLVFVAKQNTSDTREWTYIRKDGTRLPALLSVTAIKNEANQIIGYLGIAYDLTERKEIDQMKNELIAITSHELRSPVASIKGTLDLLSEEGIHLSDQAQRIIEIGKKNCGRLARIVDDLIDLQQIQIGKFNLNFRKMNFSVFLSKVIQSNTPLAQQSNVEIKCQLVPKDWFIEADESRLIQAMNKLILNAINYSHNKSRVIDISAYKVDTKIHVEVKNEGSGISPEFQHKVFQPFMRDPSIIYAEKKGTGLELNLAKSIIEKHRGSIGFITSSNEMIFWFELPMLNPDINKK